MSGTLHPHLRLPRSGYCCESLAATCEHHARARSTRRADRRSIRLLRFPHDRMPIAWIVRPRSSSAMVGGWVASSIAQTRAKSTNAGSLLGCGAGNPSRLVQTWLPVWSTNGGACGAFLRSSGSRDYSRPFRLSGGSTNTQSQESVSAPHS